jgi:hypothetical protein
MVKNFIEQSSRGIDESNNNMLITTKEINNDDVSTMSFTVTVDSMDNTDDSTSASASVSIDDMNKDLSLQTINEEIILTENKSNKYHKYHEMMDAKYNTSFVFIQGMFVFIFITFAPSLLLLYYIILIS